MEEIKIIENLLLDDEFVVTASEYFNLFAYNDESNFYSFTKEFYNEDSGDFDNFYTTLKNSNYENNLIFLKLCTLIDNKKAKQTRLDLINIALDLINLSTGGYATLLNNKQIEKIQAFNQNEFENILSNSSDSLIRLKERE